MTTSSITIKFCCLVNDSIRRKDLNWLKVNPNDGLLSILDFIDLTNKEIDYLNNHDLLNKFFKLLIDCNFDYLVYDDKYHRYVIVDFYKLKKLLSDFITFYC